MQGASGTATHGATRGEITCKQQIRAALKTTSIARNAMEKQRISYTFSNVSHILEEFSLHCRANLRLSLEPGYQSEKCYRCPIQ